MAETRNAVNEAGRASQTPGGGQPQGEGSGGILGGIKGQAQDMMSSFAQTGVDQLAGTARQMASRVGDQMLGQMSFGLLNTNNVGDLAGTVSTFVQRNPIPAVLISIAAGYLYSMQQRRSE